MGGSLGGGRFPPEKGGTEVKTPPHTPLVYMLAFHHVKHERVSTSGVSDSFLKSWTTVTTLVISLSSLVITFARFNACFKHVFFQPYLL